MATGIESARIQGLPVSYMLTLKSTSMLSKDMPEGNITAWHVVKNRCAIFAELEKA